MERLAEPLTLAAHANMSVRTFTRRFRDETGTTPSQWLIRQRVDLARHYLETTDWPVDLVAHRAGFGTGVSLRRHLHAAIGVTPPGLPPHLPPRHHDRGRLNAECRVRWPR
ncbi:helix-turn-helix domain-containing protein [Nonomuraea sediminis]|uniref:helix-turn-helix domain-containing protein n=1 Tax=Nonomuraea sediminis TaxID=2835864 RepID=UPI0027E08494|nr:helix-turn-helix domain-containing protein [Nonomuraea sediminis]